MSDREDPPGPDTLAAPAPAAAPAARKAEALKSEAAREDTALTRADALATIAGDYGDRALGNYSQTRNIAQGLRDRLSEHMCDERDCVFLVPPSGKFGARNYGSRAFSVSGKGFLPLEPISFGLAVRVSRNKDYIRIVVTVRREGDTIYLTPDTGKPYRVSAPPTEEQYAEVVESLYAYLVDWFASRIDRYDNGSYGNNDIGFDIIRAVAEDEDLPDDAVPAPPLEVEPMAARGEG